MRSTQRVWRREESCPSAHDAISLRASIRLDQSTHREIFREPFDTLPFALVLPVEAFGVELIPQTKRFDFAVELRQVCFFRSGKIEPAFPSSLALELCKARSTLVDNLGNMVITDGLLLFLGQLFLRLCGWWRGGSGGDCG